MAIRYEITAVSRGDEDDLLELAKHLNSVNLPHDPAEIGPIVAKSDDSFGAVIEDPRRRTYVFVLRDLEEQKAIGSSLIVAQLGRRDAPYIYYRVRKEERYSQSLDKHFVHDVLSIGYSYDGPTEIGGLIMHPGCRRVGAKLGMQISYVRFLWMAMKPLLFQNQVLAELLPPLEPDGTSHLWEAVGRKFTDMSYRDADRLSRENKEFIRGLFPDGDIYASLLPPDAQAVIGEVGPQTKGVEKILRRIGFRYVNRVDPFDGGPHFACPMDEITLVQRATRRKLRVNDSIQPPKRALIAKTYEKPPWFRAVAVPAEVSGEDYVTVGSEVLEHLELPHDAMIWSLPLD